MQAAISRHCSTLSDFNPEFIKRFVAYNEEYIMKTTMAMMDAGIKVILNGDDFSYKTGPVMNPNVVDELFGPPYTKLTKAVHDRGGKILIHSCGDNTKQRRTLPHPHRRRPRRPVGL